MAQAKLAKAELALKMLDPAKLARLSPERRALLDDLLQDPERVIFAVPKSNEQKRPVFYDGPGEFESENAVAFVKYWFDKRDTFCAEVRFNGYQIAAGEYLCSSPYPFYAEEALTDLGDRGDAEWSFTTANKNADSPPL